MQQDVLSGAMAVQEEQEEQFGPALVNVLERHGITAADCKKLQEVKCLLRISYSDS